MQGRLDRKLFILPAFPFQIFLILNGGLSQRTYDFKNSKKVFFLKDFMSYNRRFWRKIV